MGWDCTTIEATDRDDAIRRALMLEFRGCDIVDTAVRSNYAYVLARYTGNALHLTRTLFHVEKLNTNYGGGAYEVCTKTIGVTYKTKDGVILEYDVDDIPLRMIERLTDEDEKTALLEHMGQVKKVRKEALDWLKEVPYKRKIRANDGNVYYYYPPQRKFVYYDEEDKCVYYTPTKTLASMLINGWEIVEQ